MVIAPASNTPSTFDIASAFAPLWRQPADDQNTSTCLPSRPRNPRPSRVNTTVRSLHLQKSSLILDPARHFVLPLYQIFAAAVSRQTEASIPRVRADFPSIVVLKFRSWRGWSGRWKIKLHNQKHNHQKHNQESESESESGMRDHLHKALEGGFEEACSIRYQFYTQRPRLVVGIPAPQIMINSRDDKSNRLRLTWHQRRRICLLPRPPAGTSTYRNRGDQTFCPAESSAPL